MAHNTSLVKLPGLVDIHVHLRDPGATQKEDFSTGTQAAVAGGYTQILDMPNNNPPTVTSDALDDKIILARDRIWCDVGFNFGATRESTQYFKSVRSKAFGLKVYMNHTTGPLLVENNVERELIFKSWSSQLPIMVHAEGETLDVAIKVAKKFRKKIHACHITGDQIELIQKAKADGINITCEVSPHHLFLTKADAIRLGPLGIMKPPLMDKIDQQKLWEHLGSIDIIATDHAPHTLDEKNSDPAPFGIPGLETALPLMLKAVAQKKLTIERLIEMMATNPRRIFHLPSQPDTFVLVDFVKTYKISSKNLFTKCGWTPFEGLNGRGEVIKVVIRGKVIYQDGNFFGKPIGNLIVPVI